MPQGAKSFKLSQAGDVQWGFEPEPASRLARPSAPATKANIRPIDNVLKVAGQKVPAGATGYWFDYQGKLHWQFKTTTKKEYELKVPPAPLFPKQDSHPGTFK